ncbi:MAG TPA: SDR family oxidoreductase [Gemmatimonadaceae bacterium]|nr:SDR family oxidoreductase [Gemmatimonadaceae bacterium]
MSGALDGRTAVVSGASRGIGAAIARTLAGAGARVALLGRSKGSLQGRAAELGAEAVTIVCDVAEERDVARAATEIEERFGGPPAILVNNAGRFVLAPAHELSPDDFRSSIDVNLVAPFVLVRAFLAAMRARGTGHIVSIGSIADHSAFPENAAYAASKFGLRGLHEVLRAELRGTGVHATLVSPGPTDTPLWDPIDPDTRPGFTPRASMLRPEAIAEAVLFAVTREPAVNIDEIRLSAG